MARRKVTRGAPPQLARSSRNKSLTKSNSEPEKVLSVYFREMSDLDVMSAEQELAAATQIFELRKAYWSAILAYPPFIDGIVACIESQIDAEEVPAKELKAMRKASRDVRDRETRAHRDSYDAAMDALIERMLDLDTDMIVADRIAADVNAIESGARHGLDLAVRPPREGSRPFASYAVGIRRASRRLRAAKNAFVKANLRLVVSIARRFNHGRMPLQDLIQEGNIGLMKAVDRFDYRKGFRFSTYGSWWIRHAISRAIANNGRQVRLPVHMIETCHKVNRAKRELGAKYIREPTIDEVAEHTGLDPSKIEKMETMVLADYPLSISIDSPVFDIPGNETTGIVSLNKLEDASAEIPGDRLEAEAINQIVSRIMLTLQPIEADILRKRFGFVQGEGLTLREISGHHNLSRERIRQLQERALKKIRYELKHIGIMDL